MSLSDTLGPFGGITKDVGGDPLLDAGDNDFLKQDILKGEFDFSMIPSETEWQDVSGLSGGVHNVKQDSEPLGGAASAHHSRHPSGLVNAPLFPQTPQDVMSPPSYGFGLSGSMADSASFNSRVSQSPNNASPSQAQINVNHKNQLEQSTEYKPPFLVDLQMVCKTMEGVNRALGIDLGGTEVNESVLQVKPEENTENGNDSPRESASTKSEMSHVRLISDACGHIVTSVGNAVLQAAREAHKENVLQGKPNMPPKAPIRKKRGGILGFKELATRANLSPWHFHRVFRFVTGVTPKAYGEALWEYLMIEYGFDLDKEELIIIRAVNVGGPGEGSAAANNVTTSSSSSSSPQSPVMGPLPTLSGPNKPFSKTLSAGSQIAPASEQSTLAPLSGPVVPGRIRKNSSRSRGPRSRSRNRSQTQSQVLSGLVGDAVVPEGAPISRGRSFSRVSQRPVFMTTDQALQGAFPGNGPIQNNDQHIYQPSVSHDMMQQHPNLGMPRNDGALQNGGMAQDFSAVEFVPQHQMYPLDLPDMTNLNLDQSAAAEILQDNQPQPQYMNMHPHNQQNLYQSRNSPTYYTNNRNYHDGGDARNNKNASTVSNTFHSNLKQGNSQLNNGVSNGAQVSSGSVNPDHINPVTPTFSPNPIDKSLNNYHQTPNSNKQEYYQQGLHPIEGDLYRQQNSRQSSHEIANESNRTNSHPENLQENLQWELKQQQNDNSTKHDQLSDLPASFYTGFEDTTPYGDESQFDANFSSMLIGDEDPPLMPAWDGNESSY